MKKLLLTIAHVLSAGNVFGVPNTPASVASSAGLTQAEQQRYSQYFQTGYSNLSAAEQADFKALQLKKSKGSRHFYGPGGTILVECTY